MKFHGNPLFRLSLLAIVVLSIYSTSNGNPPALVNDSASASLLAKGEQRVSIPFEITERGHILLSVRVNGSEPMWFGFDSGTEQTLVSQRQAAALKLKLQGEMQAAGTGEETVDFALAKNVSFTLSGVNFVLREIGVLPLEFSSSDSSHVISGLIGYDFVRRFVVEIDYAAHVMNLYSPRSYRYRGRGESVPIRMMDNNPHVSVKIVLPGLAPVKGMFVIDSGSGTDVEFYSPFVKAHRLLDSAQEMTEASTEGIGGISRIRIGRAINLQIGSLVIQNPVVHFSMAMKGDNASTIGAGVIGGKLLRQFKKVIFDQTRRRLILEPDEQSR